MNSEAIQALLLDLADTHTALKAIPVIPYEERTTENLAPYTKLLDRKIAIEAAILKMALALRAAQ